MGKTIKETRENCFSMVRGHAFNTEQLTHFSSFRQRASAWIRRDIHEQSVVGLRIVLTNEESKNAL